LPDSQRLTLEAARWLKEGFLQQSAYDPRDMFCSPARQMKMLRLILDTYRKAREVLERGVPFYRIQELEGLAGLYRMKADVGEDQLARFDELAQTLAGRLEELVV